MQMVVCVALLGDLLNIQPKALNETNAAPERHPQWASQDTVKGDQVQDQVQIPGVS